MDKFVVICDDIRSLYNVGSVFRTSDAVGADKIYLCGISGRPDRIKAREKISKVALGAEKTVAWEYRKQSWRLIDELRRQGFEIVSLELTPKSVIYTKFRPKFPSALVIGNEVLGVKKSLLDRSDKFVQIPMRGEKESLNVSVAFGIVASWIGEFK
jgi:23S rRNA (guanosine2251-2'-O)-methyltransferase